MNQIVIGFLQALLRHEFFLIELLPRAKAGIFDFDFLVRFVMVPLLLLHHPDKGVFDNIFAVLVGRNAVQLHANIFHKVFPDGFPEKEETVLSFRRTRCFRRCLKPLFPPCAAFRKGVR